MFNTEFNHLAKNPGLNLRPDDMIDAIEEVCNTRHTTSSSLHICSTKNWNDSSCYSIFLLTNHSQKHAYRQMHGFILILTTECIAAVSQNRKKHTITHSRISLKPWIKQRCF